MFPKPFAFLYENTRLDLRQTNVRKQHFDGLNFSSRVLVPRDLCRYQVQNIHLKRISDLNPIRLSNVQ